jgi:hypothetical protein
MFSIFPSKVWSKWIAFKRSHRQFKRDHWGTRGVERGQCLKEQTGNPAQTEMSAWVKSRHVRRNKLCLLCSQLRSQNADICIMSALPPKADMCGAATDVRLGQKRTSVSYSTHKFPSGLEVWRRELV